MISGIRQDLDPADQGEVAVAVPDHPGADADGVVPGGARPLRREDRPGEAEEHAGLAGGEIGAEIGQKIRADLERTQVGVIIHGDAEGVGAVQGRSDQAGGPRAGRGIHIQAGVLQGLPADLHGQEDKVGIPERGLLPAHIGETARIPVGNLADHIAAGVDLAPAQAAKAGQASGRALPGLGEGTAEGGGGTIADHQYLSVEWRLHDPCSVSLPSTFNRLS